MQEALNNSVNRDLPPRHREPRDITINEEQLRDLIYNATTRDNRVLRNLLQEKRDYDSECDYPRELTVQDHYKFYFDYHAVATRVVEVYPLESWQVTPTIFEDDDPNVKTEFEKAWDELGASLRGQSWHKQEEGSPVWEYLKRADILSGIGSFGVILLGFDDGQPLNTPIAMLSEEDDEDEAESWETSESMEDDGESFESGKKEPTTNAQGSIDSQYNGSIFGQDKIPKLKEGTRRKLIFMRPFDESLVQVTRIETDITSPRHGQPVMYRITLIDPDFAKEHSISMDISCPEVHWTRILHLADNLTNSEAFGVPRQQPVYRHLRNLYKLYGGAPEMYWRGALNGLSFETHPQLGGDVEIDKTAFRDMIEDFRNGLQRDLQTSGMSVKSIAPTVVDPTPNIEVQITAICIKLGCPKRIFMGSERGELASTQDDSSWNDRLKHRQDTYVTPRIIIPFIDRMIATGVLPKPSGNVVESNLTEEDTDQENEQEQTQNFNPNQPRDNQGQWSSGGGSSYPVTDIADSVKEIYKRDHNPKDGGECGSVAITLMQLNPSLKAFAITTKSPYDENDRGISHVLVSADGKQFFDGKGQIKSKSQLLSPKHYDPKDRPEIVPLTYDSKEKMFVSKDAGVQDGEIWTSFLQDITSSLQEDKEGKPTANAFGKGYSFAYNAFPNDKPSNSPIGRGGSVGSEPNGQPAPEAKSRKLPERSESYGYCVVWPDLESMTDAQKAAIALQKTQALMAFIAGNGESAMTLMDFYTKVFNLTDEEAIGVIQAVNEQIEDDERLTPDPEQARIEQMEMEGEKFDKELEAKKELAESGQGFQAAMFDKQTEVESERLKAQPKGKPVANFNPNQPRDAEGQWSSGGKALMYRGIGEGADTSSGFEWFSETPDLATKYANFRGGKIISQVVEIQKPLMVSNPNAVTDSRGFFAQATKQIDPSKLDHTKVKKARESFNSHFGTQSREIIDYWSNPEAKERTRNLLESMGYDSIVMKEGKETTVAILRKTPVANLSALDKARMLVNYNPNQKRDNRGRWSGGGAVKTTSKGEELHAVTKVNAEGKPVQLIGKKWEDGEWVGANGTPAPEHIQKLAIPPAWTEVHVNPDPNGTMLARGVDSKGRAVYKYSATADAKNAAAKFGRVSELRKKRASIFKELDNDALNPIHKENAECLKVIMQTGIRPGSQKDTGADFKSYGATTLQGSHVKTRPDGSVYLKFVTGKNKGREVEFPINDPDTAAMLLKRAKAAGPNGSLFRTDSSSLRDYSKTKDGKGFKTKDHRTALGTETAIREIQKRPAPKNQKEYKKAVMDVAKVVSDTLGNTPSVALKSYIDPSVFGSWKPAEM